MHTQRPKNQAHSHSLPPPTVRWLSLCGVIRRLLMNFICLSACRQNSVFFLSLLVWLVCLPLCPLLLSIRMRNLQIHILFLELHWFFSSIYFFIILQILLLIKYYLYWMVFFRKINIWWKNIAIEKYLNHIFIFYGCTIFYGFILYIYFSKKNHSI